MVGYLRRLGLGAACESAEPAAVFDVALVRLSLRTLLAALAARALVLRCAGMITSYSVCDMRDGETAL